MIDLPRKKWRDHKWRCKQRGLQPLTYEQYLAKLQEAGITVEQVGRTLGGYHLARYTDSGDYTPDSCRFVPAEVNRAEAFMNGRMEIGRQKVLGRTKHTHEGIARGAEKRRGRTAETHPSIATRAARAGDTMRGRTKQTHASHARAAEKNSCDFAFIDPSGKLHTGRGMNDFSKANGLHSGSMSKLKTGKLKSYHGWKLAPCCPDETENSPPE